MATGVARMVLWAMAEIDFNLLTALEALLAEGTVAGAARRLHLSESAMSRTLARLRAATGDPILVRAGRDMVPTPRAEALRREVGALTQAVRNVLQPDGAALDPAGLDRVFAIRANESFAETFAAPLVTALALSAPKVRLHFVPKPDKDATPLREGRIDLDIGVMGAEAGPELRVQSLYRDRFLGVAREGHPLFDAAITPERYAGFGHVMSARRANKESPVDTGLAALGLEQRIDAVVQSFPAALAVVSRSDLLSLAPETYLVSVMEFRRGLRSFPLPVETKPITVSLMWHPRVDADPAHRWLRGVILETCGKHS
ncbi:LysR family transcriptional regulator [Dongia sedimenti]|uniref:LysR family transcriptional regulator n=1 Tax=Dongia sedimenti TaxID=3064282 RepID=A0ABU0YG07_9PROT|nr:LysR family transcriptional regulator [Rhodospirillaceae bacterium R-7]